MAGNRHDVQQILSKGLTHFFTFSCFTEVILINNFIHQINFI